MINIKALSEQVQGIRAGPDEQVQALVAIAEQLGRIADLMDSEASAALWKVSK